MLRRSSSLLVAASLCLTPGCFAYKDVKRDRDERPIVMTGVSGTILYPGQGPGAVPTLPPTGSSSASASRGPSGTSGSRQASGGSGMPSAGEPVFIGGNESTVDQHYREHREPKWYNPFWFPFAVMLFPIRAAREVVDYVRGEPAAPAASPAPLPPHAPYSQREDMQRAYEHARLEALQRQLAEQRARGGAPPTASSGVPPHTGAAPPRTTAATPRAGSPSIEEELAALRAASASGSSRERAPTAPPELSTARAPSASSPAPAEAVADRVEDRDRDGQPDRWLYSRSGHIVRERFDDDGDGIPERAIYYDPESGLRDRVEEDTNQDRRVDAWAYYESGKLARRRTDRDGDGAIDAWSFYRDERIAREELDTNGDGFRDRVDFYETGHLARREEDTNGDGRAERVTLFDPDGAPSQVDEDRDADGHVDVRSHYREGRLIRRELLTEVAAQNADRTMPSMGAP